jgi:hypothetical protein
VANEAAEPVYGRLHDLAFDLVQQASALGATLQPRVAEAMAAVVRSVDARCSAEIDGDEVDEGRHSAVEKRIDTDGDALGHPASAAFLAWTYRELYGFDGVVGDLSHFESIYTAVPGRLRQSPSVPASYHRLVQIRPFAHGDGPVARLMAHAQLTRLGIGGLWSLSRALRRECSLYRELVTAPGESDETGIFGNRELMEFCRFFLSAAIEEVRSMRALIDPAALLTSIETYCGEERAAGRLPEGCYAVLREVILRGELRRPEVTSILPFKERKARQITSRLRETGLLVSSGVREPLRIAFPEDAVARLFPGLSRE